MRGSPAAAHAPSLDTRLEQLDAQLHEFETALRAHQQSHERVRRLELELAALVDRGAGLIRDLAASGDAVRHAADAATRDALAASADRVQEFEQKARHILDAYANAVRAAQQAVARAEARIEAFDERVARDLEKAGRDVRDAAALLKERAPADAQPAEVTAPRSTRGRVIPGLIVALIVLGGLAASLWIARTLRDGSARAATAEREAQDVRRDAEQRLAAVERTTRQAHTDALAHAAGLERMIGVLAAPETQRLDLIGQRRAPNATGQALWTRQGGVVITAVGLPEIPVKETYQVWLVTTRDIISLGVVHPDGSGRVSGVFDLPSTMTGTVRGFMLTREPAQGSSRPSRTVVLAS